MISIDVKISAYTPLGDCTLNTVRIVMSEVNSNEIIGIDCDPHGILWLNAEELQAAIKAVTV